MVDAFSPFDAADYLSDFDDAAAYLEAVIDEGGDDPGQITQALVVIARCGNISELSRRAGMSREGLYKALSAGTRRRRRRWRGWNGHRQLLVDHHDLSA